MSPDICPILLSDHIICCREIPGPDPDRIFVGDHYGVFALQDVGDFGQRAGQTRRCYLGKWYRRRPGSSIPRRPVIVAIRIAMRFKLIRIVGGVDLMIALKVKFDRGALLNPGTERTLPDQS